MDQKFTRRSGFTLIEMSIVLVIIGLVVGGILVGQTLIASAATRAQISQVDSYRSAVNAFDQKFGGLPGDLVYNRAGQYGFNVSNCQNSQGMRDGNGLIESGTGLAMSLTYPSMYGQQDGDEYGEIALVWEDLSTAQMIPEAFPTGLPSFGCSQLDVLLSTANTGKYVPAGKIGQGNFIRAFAWFDAGHKPGNWFSLSKLDFGQPSKGITDGKPGLTVQQAYDIDKKIDDGMPLTGDVQAVYVTSPAVPRSYPNFHHLVLSPSAASPSAATCYDTTSNNYSVSQNSSNMNCALSFQFQ